MRSARRKRSPGLGLVAAGIVLSVGAIVRTAAGESPGALVPIAALFLVLGTVALARAARSDQSAGPPRPNEHSQRTPIRPGGARVDGEIDDEVADVDVEVRHSPIEGLGLFALRAISEGQRVRRVNVIREVTADRPLRPELGERPDHCDYADGKVVLVGPPDRHLNHSCDPNCYLRYDGTICTIVARRYIPMGAELTCDYSLNAIHGDSWPCSCGASRCRGEVTGDFFSLPVALQREYLAYLAEWFVRAQRDRLESLGDLPTVPSS